MKRIVFILLSILCVSFSVCARADDPPQSIPITIILNSEQEEHTHRSPSSIPIWAYYNTNASAVDVFFQQDLGEIHIIVTNLSSGVYAEYDIYSSIGVALIPIWTDYGQYTLSFRLSDGRCFEGSFILQ